MNNKYSPIAHFREYTGLKWVKRGARVLTYVEGGSNPTIKAGTVMNAYNYIKIRLDGEKHGRNFHKADVKPIHEAAQLWRSK